MSLFPTLIAILYSTLKVKNLRLFFFNEENKAKFRFPSQYVHQSSFVVNQAKFENTHPPTKKKFN